ncbi:MAG TPA: hypothetical protein VM536_22055 [Chloroflexia bacterium]|nr:hypothetical protein [Chloroflexia bacterium]
MAITFIVIGGGCYGSHHLARLERGRARGKIDADARVLIVDRNPACQVRRELAEAPNPRVEIVQADWLAFMQAEFDHLPATDEVVPAPIAPHLAAEWLLWSLQARLPAGAVSQVPFDDTFGGLPYEHLSPAGERFFSAAGWICPPNCRAPKKCPAILAPRTWDLEETVRTFSQARPDRYADPAVFRTVYRTTGIETIPVGWYRDTRDRLLNLALSGEAAGKQVIVSTLSPCHGAANLLRFAAPEALATH